MTWDTRLTEEGPMPSTLAIQLLPIAVLKPYPRNARTHSKKQIRQIADSIRRFGFTNPILIDAGGGIIAGHGRVEAAKLLEMETVPTICLDKMTEEEKRAYILADNKLAQNADWDQALLAVELQYLAEIDFDVELTGFEPAEIDLVIESFSPGSAEEGEAETVLLPDPSQPTVGELGDLWQLGRHRLFCGDARDAEAYQKLMAGKKAQMVITDPPYNVPIAGHVSGLGRTQHKDFVMGSGEMSEPEFTAFLEASFRNLAAHSTHGSIHFVFMDWRHLSEVLAAGRNVYTELKNICVWAKTNAGMGSLYRSQHEFVLVFKNGAGRHINNVELGKFGRNRSNVWRYAGVNTLKPDRMDELALHPTVKPVALVADAIKDCSKRNGIILDPFVGSGTIFIAAGRSGRKAYGLELDPRYVDTAIRRWQEETGEPARHAESGLSFAEIEASRAESAGAAMPEGPHRENPETREAANV